MSRDELRKRAAELNITGRSKMNKDELTEAVRQAENELEASVGTIERTTPVMDRVGPTAIVTNEDGHTTVDDMHDTGRFFTWPNPDELPSVESAHRMRPMGKTNMFAKLSERRIVRMIRASGSRRYGQGGRGMGAKHFASGLDPFTGHTLPFGRVNNPDAIKPLAYGDRVRHYAKQAGQPTASADGFPGPALTARQWRRIDKKDNKLKFGPSHATKERRYV